MAKIFKNEKDRLYAIFNELNKSYYKQYSNLTETNINNYLNYKNQNPIIVFWSGSTDKIILDRLGINEIVLSLLAYDDHNDNVFNLKLINMTTKLTIVDYKLGTVCKTGRMLSLSETHNLICNKIHKNITYLHNPVTDVILTQCIFHFLTKQLSYKTLIEMIFNSNH